MVAVYVGSIGVAPDDKRRYKWELQIKYNTGWETLNTTWSVVYAQELWRHRRKCFRHRMLKNGRKVREK
jgi:hypothetical protein